MCSLCLMLVHSSCTMQLKMFQAAKLAFFCGIILHLFCVFLVIFRKKFCLYMTSC